MALFGRLLPFSQGGLMSPDSLFSLLVVQHAAVVYYWILLVLFWFDPDLVSTALCYWHLTLD